MDLGLDGLGCVSWGFGATRLRDLEVLKNLISRVRKLKLKHWTGVVTIQLCGREELTNAREIAFSTAVDILPSLLRGYEDSKHPQ